MKEMEAHDFTKIKADILQIFKVQQTFVVREALNPINEAQHRLEQTQNEAAYDLKNISERVSENSSLIEKNYASIKTESDANRAKAENNEAAISALKKQLGLLDEKLKSLRGAAIGGGNGGGGGMSAALLDDLEAAIAQLRKDVDGQKETFEKEQVKTKT